MTTTSYRSRVAVGVRHLFPSRPYSAVRSRLGARGTMTTTSYRVARRWVFVTFFPSRHYSAVRSRLGARGTMTTTSYRNRGGGCSSLFSVEALLCCPVASFTRGTMTTTSYRSRSAVGVRHFFRRGTTLLSGRVLVHAER
ncbi:hypothetical protein TNCV_2440091 [Trichonephila clavipes]|nr:hypothetical protein TNCV_2440091 [Trichonephila clavipes]